MGSTVFFAGCATETNEIYFPPPPDEDESIDDKADLFAPMVYGGGKVLQGPVTVHFIFYGDWDSPEQQARAELLQRFVTDVSDSDYMKILSLYSEQDSPTPTSTVSVGGVTFDPYSGGTDLLEVQDIGNVVQRFVRRGLTGNENTIYAIFPSPDVRVHQHCEDAAGWHSYFQYRNARIKYMFIGDERSCFHNADAGWGPNGDAFEDETVDIFAHELTETITDPEVDAWRDASGLEIADKCVGEYGAQFQTANQRWANLRLNEHEYYVQALWGPPTSGRCGMSYTELSRSAN